jgi:hypothetical protein
MQRGDARHSYAAFSRLEFEIGSMWEVGMTHTAVGLFNNSGFAEEVVNDLKAIGIAADDVRVLAEPRYMHVNGVLGTPEIDFCTELTCDLRAMGATEDEVQTYVRGIRDGGVLVFATGSLEQVEKSAEVMNRHQGTKVEELTGAEAVLHAVAHESAIPAHGYSVQTGRVRHSGGGARVFVW